MIEITEQPFPYRARNGQRTDLLVEKIMQTPEVTLSEEERLRLQEFAHSLFNGELGDHDRINASGSLKEVVQQNSASTVETFYLDYFLQDTDESRGDLEKIGLRHPATKEEIISRLYDINFIGDKISTKQRGEIASNSRRWFIEKMAAMLGQDSALDSDTPTSESLEVNFEPSILIQKLSDLKAYRQFYQNERRSLGGLMDHVSLAKRALTDVHLGRVNSLIADIYPIAVSLIQQLEASNIPQKEDLLSQIENVAPVPSLVARRHLAPEDKSILALMTRLDYLRNGASLDKNNQISSISPELQLISNYSEKNKNQQDKLLPNELVAELDSTTWQAQDFKPFLETVLTDWNLLSNHAATWQEIQKRKGTAEDGLWQVIITPKKASLAVDSIKRVMFVPESFNRTLTAISGGALPVAAHELTHVLQGMADELLGQTLPLASIKGRGYITLREAGGVYQEQLIHEQYLGRNRPTNLHYLRALEAKIAGGNFMQVARAFHNSTGSKQNLEAKKLAIDRSMRLYRQQGHNTQPLDYIEQALIVDGLKNFSNEQVQGFLIHAGSFNLEDLAYLCTHNLVPAPEPTEISPADEVMRVFLTLRANSLEKPRKTTS